MQGGTSIRDKPRKRRHQGHSNMNIQADGMHSNSCGTSQQCQPLMNTLFLTITRALLLVLPMAALAHESGANTGLPTPAAKVQTAWGVAADVHAKARTIRVVMSDAMRFTPDRFTVQQGETIRLVVQNAGQMQHELVLGTRETLDAHAAMMVQFPDMAHDEPYMAHVPAGQTRTLFWTFNQAGAFEFACLIAGHYQAGMTGSIVVVAR
jgi:uncharacterized cupredoxin-like copper-binding protein